MIISVPDIVGLVAGLCVWFCAIVYFVTHPRNRTLADVDINNIMGWGGNKPDIEFESKRFSSTKHFQQKDNDSEQPPFFSESDSEIGNGVSKRIDLDSWGESDKQFPKKRGWKPVTSTKKIDLDGNCVNSGEEIDLGSQQPSTRVLV